MDLSLYVTCTFSFAAFNRVSCSVHLVFNCSMERKVSFLIQFVLPLYESLFSYHRLTSLFHSAVVLSSLGKDWRSLIICKNHSVEFYSGTGV